MKKIDFDFPSETQKEVSPYMETLTKETTTFSRAMKRNLSEDEALQMMMMVFASYSNQWTEAFSETTIRSEAGKARQASLTVVCARLTLTLERADSFEMRNSLNRSSIKSTALATPASVSSTLQTTNQSPSGMQMHQCALRRTLHEQRTGQVAVHHPMHRKKRRRSGKRSDRSAKRLSDLLVQY